MALMGFLKRGSHVIITFQADNANTGSTAVLAGFIPNEIDPEMIIIAPGGVDDIEFPVLPNVKRLKIEVDTPEPDGKGRMIVMQDDVIMNDESVLDDTDWVYIIM